MTSEEEENYRGTLDSIAKSYEVSQLVIYINEGKVRTVGNVDLNEILPLLISKIGGINASP